MSTTNHTPNREDTMKIQLPAAGSPHIAIQKHGGKIHAAFGANGATVGRAYCDHRVHGRIVTGERDQATICERCADRMSHHTDSTFPTATN